jgi:hypothetical protein
MMTSRKAYDAGFRLADPDSASGGPDLIPRVSLDHRLKIIRAFDRR